MSDGILFTPGRGGDAYLSMIQMARVTGRTLEDQFSATADRRLHYQQLKLVDQVVNDYKKETNKLDFVDMIEQFVAEGQGPTLDVLIVDEAQDLVPMQWRMVHEVLKTKAKRIYYAGDDDQCIYSWMGVDVRDFLRSSENKIVLDKSYRLPTAVYNLADSLVKQIDIRQKKVWSPTDKTGTVVWHRDILDVDITTGEWLILARTNFIANRIANDLKEQGFLYWREGSGWSISPNVLTGIEVWLRLCKNKQLSASELKSLSTQLNSTIITKAGRKSLANLNPEVTYTLTDIQNLCELNATAQPPWHEVLKVSDKERIYITSYRASRGFGYRRYTKPKVARRITSPYY